MPPRNLAKLTICAEIYGIQGVNEGHDQKQKILMHSAQTQIFKLHILTQIKTLLLSTTHKNFFKTFHEVSDCSDAEWFR